MSDERDRFLTESMGECWHEYDLDAPVLTCKGGGFVCRKCREFLVSNNDFSTEEDFERLLRWAHARADLRSLLPRLSNDLPGRKPLSHRERMRLVRALYEFLSR